MGNMLRYTKKSSNLFIVIVPIFSVLFGQIKLLLIIESFLILTFVSSKIVILAFGSPLSQLHTSKFSLTIVIDNFHLLMFINDKFSLTSFALPSFICWCEQMNKFSLTSFHCSRKFNYTADNNFLDTFSLSIHTDQQVLQLVKFFFTHQQITLVKENLLVCNRL